MAEIHVEFGKLNDFSSRKRSMSRAADDLRQQVDHVRTSLDWAIKSSVNIDRTLSNVCQDIYLCSRVFSSMADYLSQAVLEYANCENEIALSQDGTYFENGTIAAENNAGWFKQWIHEHKEEIELTYKTLSWISAGTAFLGAITFWCPPVAASLDTISLTTGLTTTGIDAALAATGEGASAGDVLLGLIGATPGVGLLYKDGSKLIHEGKAVGEITSELFGFQELPKVLEKPISDWANAWYEKGVAHHFAAQIADYLGGTIALISAGSD